MAGRVERFEDLDAYRTARALNAACFAAIEASPRLARAWGLRDQIERATVSVMGNIAEGFERSGSPEFAHALSIAKGSCGEVRSHLHAALDMKYVEQHTYDELVDLALQTSRLVAALRSAVLRTHTQRR